MLTTGDCVCLCVDKQKYRQDSTPASARAIYLHGIKRRLAVESLDGLKNEEIKFH